MLGTLSLVAAGVLGFLNVKVWWIVPLIILNNFIGMHTPPERMERLREMGASYWGFFFTNIPLIALLTAAIYGAGYGIGLLF